MASCLEDQEKGLPSIMSLDPGKGSTRYYVSGPQEKGPPSVMSLDPGPPSIMFTVCVFYSTGGQHRGSPCGDMFTVYEFISSCGQH